MMKIGLLSFVLFTFCLVLFANEGTAQDKRVKFSFKVDTKPVKEKFKVTLYINGGVIEPEMCGDSFTVPLEIGGTEFVGVRFVSDKYDLYFDEVSVNSFKSDWDVGVDNRPFEKENINPERGYEKVEYIYYMKFDRFAITIEVGKNKNPKN